MRASAPVLKKPTPNTKKTALSVVANANIPYSSSDENKDYFKEENGLKFAGTHLIIDVWNAENLDNLQLIEDALKECVDVSGATLLHIHLHHFTPNGGVSGVAVLSESHISIHTWPERKYAALDVFMCGDAQPHKSIAVLQRAFGGKCTIQLNELKRGLVV
jgi:S-adenosylmethionine decarboxylase